MAGMKERYGGVALVTGASSGIGAAFCRKFAASGLNVVAVARRSERLTALKEELEAQYRITVTPIPLDVSDKHAVEQLSAALESAGIEIDILVNNAGFGVLGTVESISREKNVGMVDLNCRAVVDLTAHFLPAMKARRRGAVIIVSSVVGTIAAPWFATYSATKAFDLYFGEALHGECRGSGVDVLTVLPGLTRTEFQAGAGLREYHSPYRSAEQVVETACAALGRKSIVVDGWLNKIMSHGVRFLPRSLALAMSRVVMKRELGM
jgi:short-subunit dehydrogenase